MFSLFALFYYSQLDFFTTYCSWILLDSYWCSRHRWEEALMWLIAQKNEILAVKMWLDWSLPIRKKNAFINQRYYIIWLQVFNGKTILILSYIFPFLFKKLLILRDEEGISLCFIIPSDTWRIMFSVDFHRASCREDSFPSLLSC